MVHPKGPRKPPVIMDEAKGIELIKKKALEKRGQNTSIALNDADKEYLSMIYEQLKAKVESNISGDVVKSATNVYRYTPLQMWNNIKRYFELTIQYGQPLTITGMCMFNGLDHVKMRAGAIEELPEPFHFLKDCREFVMAYNEYAAHRKMNPAGPIFILKNFGWKDKQEVELSATQGAITAEERAENQRRIANFTEAKFGVLPEENGAVHPKTEE